MLYPQALIAPSGRIFVRHPSGMGSVMFFDDRGIQRSVLVLDAKYRTCKRVDLYGIEISEFQDFLLEEPNRHCLDYPTNRSTEAPDSWISENIAWDPMTSRERCDIWMKYKYVKGRINPRVIGSPAIKYCRNIQVNDVPCDLPNIQTLARIFVDRETIDQMDPTVEEYPEWRLKEWNFSGTQFAWSSTDYSTNNCWCVICNGDVNDLGKYDEFSVIPILEL